MRKLFIFLITLCINITQVSAAPYTNVTTITKSGEYNFKNNDYNNQLIDQYMQAGKTLINIENNSTINITHRGGWPIIDIYNNSGCPLESDPESAAIINGSLNLTQLVTSTNDSRVINLMKGNSKLAINGDVAVSFQGENNKDLNIWYDAFRNYDGMMNIDGNIDLAMNIDVNNPEKNSSGNVAVNGILTYGNAITNLGTNSDKNININEISILGNKNFQSVIGINTINGILNLNSATYIKNISVENTHKGDIELIAIQAGENGITNINGDIYIDGLSAVSPEGIVYVAALTSYAGGIININESGNENRIIQIIGDIDADDTNTGTAINLKLTNKESFLKGAANSGEGNITMVLTNKAVWEITNRALSGDESYDINRKNNNITNLSGMGGIIRMNIDASTGDSNRLYINGTHTGTHYIQLNNTGLDTNGAEGTILVSVQKEQGEFKAREAENTLYWNTYELTEKTEGVTEGYSSDWYLKKITNVDVAEKKTTSVETILSSNALIYHIWRQENDTLLKRLGELHINNTDNGGWIRTHSSKISRNDENSFKNKYISYDMGYDFITKNSADLKRYLGIAFNYLNGKSNYTKGNGNNYHAGITLYNTQVYYNKSYLDVVLKTGYFNNDFNVRNSNQELISGKMYNYGISLSNEIGRRFYGIYNLYVEPQAQLTIGRLTGDSYKTSNNIKVKQKDINSAIGRLGLNLGYNFTAGTIYAKTGILHEFEGKSNLRMINENESIRVRNKYDDTWMEYGIGFNWNINSQSYFYSNAECGKGKDYNNNWSWEAGFRYNF